MQQAKPDQKSLATLSQQNPVDAKKGQGNEQKQDSEDDEDDDYSDDEFN